MLIRPYLELMRLHKPVGFFLLVWPTLWGLWLAGQGKPELYHVIIFIVGVLLMRSAGCVMNDIADREFDKHVTRTKDRPLTAQKITLQSAIMLLFLLALCSFALVLMLNQLTIYLSFLGAMLAVIYPYLKRITHLPQIGLGLAFAWGVPMAFAAETGTVSTLGWFVFLAAAIWPVMYDTLYAMVDQPDDLKVGIKSTAILFGKQTVSMIVLLQFFFLCILMLVGIFAKLHYPFFMSLVVVTFLFGYQVALISSKEPSAYFKAFLNNQWVGLVIFLGILLSEGL